MINNDLQTIIAERCEITSRHTNEKKEWRIVRVNTESWRRKHGCALPRLTSTAEADSDKARVSRIVQLLENGGRADNRLRVGLWGGRWERDRAHTAQYGGVAAAQSHRRAAWQAPDSEPSWRYAVLLWHCTGKRSVVAHAPQSDQPALPLLDTGCSEYVLEIAD